MNILLRFFGRKSTMSFNRKCNSFFNSCGHLIWRSTIHKDQSAPNSEINAHSFPHPEIKTHPFCSPTSLQICSASSRITSWTYIRFTPSGPSREKAVLYWRFWFLAYDLHSSPKCWSLEDDRHPKYRTFTWESLGLAHYDIYRGMKILTVRSSIDSLLDYGSHRSDPRSRSNTNDWSCWIFRQV